MKYGIDGRMGLIDGSMKRALEVQGARLVAYRVTIEGELNDIFAHYDAGTARTSKKIAFGIERMANAHMTKRIEDALVGEDPVRDHEILLCAL
jgi:hypothetical protein